MQMADSTQQKQMIARKERWHTGDGRGGSGMARLSENSENADAKKKEEKKGVTNRRHGTTLSIALLFGENHYNLNRIDRK
jgi:hypothetical protein